MKTIIFLLLTTAAFGQDTLYITGRIANTEGVTYALRTPETIHRSDTISVEWVVIAGSDGVLRKERQVIVIKEYDRVTNIFWHIDENLRYKRLDGELIDVILIKE